MNLNLVWSYSNGELTATGPFLFSIEGMNAMVNFTFNKKYVDYDPIIFSFAIKGSKNKLEFIESTSQTKTATFKMIMLGFACVSLLLLLVGSFLHKMIGIEFLHSLQLIYYLHFTFKNYSIAISALQSLSLTTFNNLYWQIENQNLQMVE